MTDLAPSPLVQALPRNVLDTLFDTELRLRHANASLLGHPFNLQPMPNLPASLSTLLIRHPSDDRARPAPAAGLDDLERQVVDWLARVWGGPSGPEIAGSVLANGTEANLRALHLGRETLPGAILVHGADAHPSIPHAGRLLGLETRKVASTPAGEIDLADLHAALTGLHARTVILALTCGTGMKGAHDDIAGALRVLDQAGCGPDRRFVHLDGALSGMVLPFLPGAPPQIRPDFGLGIDSISICGHKMIGTPMPCGVLLWRGNGKAQASGPVSATDPGPDPMTGARNGHAVLALWTRLMVHGLAGYARDSLRCTLRAGDLAASLRALGARVLLNPWSLTLVFPQPADEIVQAFQLACQDGTSRAIIMPSVTDSLIDRFLSAYSAWFMAAGSPN